MLKIETIEEFNDRWLIDHSGIKLIVGPDIIGSKESSSEMVCQSISKICVYVCGFGFLLFFNWYKCYIITFTIYDGLLSIEVKITLSSKGRLSTVKAGIR